MTRLISVLSAFLAAASPAAAQVKIVTTTTDLASIARAVGGDLVEVEAIARASEDPHRVTATPGMVVALARADLFVQNGLDLEVGWVPALLRSARNPSLLPGGSGFVDASNRVPLLEVPKGPVDRSMGDLHPYGNPHYTLDPVRAKRAAWNIANGLHRVDPSKAEVYDRNLTAFYARVDEAVARARERFAPHRGAKVLVYHKRFEYLLDRLGLAVVGAIEPLPGIPPSASHIADLIARHRASGVRAVLIDPWNDRRVAERVAAAIGAVVVEPCPAVGACEGASDIVALFERNVEALLRAFR